MMNVVHFLDRSDRKHFSRTLLIGLNDKKRSIYNLVIHRDYEDFINDEYENIFFFYNKKEAFKIINDLKPGCVLLTLTPSKHIINELKKYIKCSNYVYVHHGIFRNYVNFDSSLKIWDKTINYMVCGIYGEKIIKKNVTGNVMRLQGLPQFDLAMSTKNIDIRKLHNIASNKYIVLIVNGNDKNKELLCDIIDNIEKIVDNVVFLLKSKRCKYTPDIVRDNLIVLNYSSFIYPYFKSDVVIVIDGFTSLIESLLVNKNTVYYTTSKNNIINIPFYANNVRDLLSVFSRCITNDNDDNNHDKNDFINFVTGDDIKIISNDILEYIVTNFS